MRPEVASKETAVWSRWVVALWTVTLVVVCAGELTGASRSTLTKLWGAAGRAWVEGRALYTSADDANLDGFRYGPPVAGLISPMGLLPQKAVGVIWRLINATVLVAGLLWWLRAAAPYSLTARQQAVVHALAAVLSVSSLYNGQINNLLAGLFLLGLASVASGRWNTAAISMALLAWVKVYPLMPCILLALLYPRRFAPRFFFALGAIALLPFALQRPDYVIEQYQSWGAFLQANDTGRRFLPFPAAYRDLLLLLRVWNIPISLPVYTCLQLGGAAACAGYCLLGRMSGLSAKALLYRILVLGTAWMLLLGPATESSTYVLCAVPLAWWVVHVHLHGSPAMKYLSDCALGLLVLCVVAVVGPAGRTLYHAAALQPLAILIWLSACLLSPDPTASMSLTRTEVGEPVDQRRTAAA